MFIILYIKLLIILLFGLIGSVFNQDEDYKEALPSLEEKLIFASKNGHTHRVKELIAAGVDVNYPDEYGGWTALMWASFNGEIEIVKKLIEAGANVNHQDYYTQRTALMYACLEGHADIVKVLIAFKDDLNFTALQYAKTEEIRQLLIEAITGSGKSE